MAGPRAAAGGRRAMSTMPPPAPLSAEHKRVREQDKMAMRRMVEHLLALTSAAHVERSDFQALDRELAAALLDNEESLARIVEHRETEARERRETAAARGPRGVAPLAPGRANKNPKLPHIARQPAHNQGHDRRQQQDQQRRRVHRQQQSDEREDARPAVQRVSGVSSRLNAAPPPRQKRQPAPRPAKATIPARARPPSVATARRPSRTREHKDSAARKLSSRQSRVSDEPEYEQKMAEERAREQKMMIEQLRKEKERKLLESRERAARRKAAQAEQESAAQAEQESAAQVEQESAGRSEAYEPSPVGTPDPQSARGSEDAVNSGREELAARDAAREAPGASPEEENEELEPKSPEPDHGAAEEVVSPYSEAYEEDEDFDEGSGPPASPTSGAYTDKSPALPSLVSKPRSPEPASPRSPKSASKSRSGSPKKPRLGPLASPRDKTAQSRTSASSSPKASSRDKAAAQPKTSSSSRTPRKPARAPLPTENDAEISSDFSDFENLDFGGQPPQ